MLSCASCGALLVDLFYNLTPLEWSNRLFDVPPQIETGLQNDHAAAPSRICSFTTLLDSINILKHISDCTCVIFSNMRSSSERLSREDFFTSSQHSTNRILPMSNPCRILHRWYRYISIFIIIGKEFGCRNVSPLLFTSGDEHLFGLTDTSKTCENVFLPRRKRHPPLLQPRSQSQSFLDHHGSPFWDYQRPRHIWRRHFSMSRVGGGTESVGGRQHQHVLESATFRMGSPPRQRSHKDAFSRRQWQGQRSREGLAAYNRPSASGGGGNSRHPAITNVESSHNFLYLKMIAGKWLTARTTTQHPSIELLAVRRVNQSPNVPYQFIIAERAVDVEKVVLVLQIFYRVMCGAFSALQ